MLLQCVHVCACVCVCVCACVSVRLYACFCGVGGDNGFTVYDGIGIIGLTANQFAFTHEYS